MPGTTVLTLPYAYRLDYQPYRTRAQKAQTWSWLRDSQPIAVSTYTSEEAPVAIEVTRRRTDGSGQVRGDRYAQLFRMIDGVLFETMASPGEAPVRVADFEAACAVRGDGVPRRYPLRDYDNPGGHFTYQQQFRDKPPARVVSSDQTERQARAAGLIQERMAIIEGEMWVAVEAEPHFVLLQSGIDQGWVVNLSTGPWRATGAATFRLDRINDVVGYAGALGKLSASFHAHLPDVMIYDDDALKRDEIVEIARGAIKDLIARDPFFGRSAGVSEHHDALKQFSAVMDTLTRNEAAIVIESVLALENDARIGYALTPTLHRWRNAEADLHDELAKLREERDADLDALSI